MSWHASIWKDKKYVYNFREKDYLMVSISQLQLNSQVRKQYVQPPQMYLGQELPAAP